MKYLYTPILILISLSAPDVSSAGDVKQAWKFQPGDKFRINLVTSYTQDQEILGRKTHEVQEMTLVLLTEILPAKEGEAYRAAQTVESIRAFVGEGDQKSEDDSLVVLKGARATIAFNDDFDVIKVDLSEFLKQFAGEDKNALELMTVIFEGFFAFWASEFFMPIPVSALAGATSWDHAATMSFPGIGELKIKKRLQSNPRADGKPQEITSTAELALLPSSKRLAAFPVKLVKADMNKGDYRSAIRFDPARGLITRSQSRFSTDMLMEMELDDGRIIKAKSVREQTITIELVLDKAEAM